MYFAQARRYDARSGRFTSEDKAKGFPVALFTLNAYGYCWNHPMDLVDLNGMWPEWVENVNEWVQNLERNCQDKKGTWTKGLDISVTPEIYQFDASICVSIDRKGNVAIQASGVGGVTIGDFALSLVQYEMTTNAESVYALEGAGTQMGGAYSAATKYPRLTLVMGGEFNIIGDVHERTKKAYGITVAAGIGVGAGMEGHVEWGETTTLFSLNIFELWDQFYYGDNGGCNLE